MKIYSKIEKNVENYYKNRDSQNDNYAKMGWKSKLAQEIRFKQLLRAFDFHNGTIINDLGCGIGDLFTYFQEKNKNNKFHYYGYDIIDTMIFESQKIHNNNNNATFIKINDCSEMNQADFTFASGIFNLKFKTSKKEWNNYIFETIRTMHKKSNIGTSFNCLTKYSDPEFMKKELYYSDPLKIFDFCKKELSKNICLFHDYNEYDFTISIRKN